MVEIYQTMVPMGSSVRKMDTIEYEGRLWLVPEWIDNHSQGWTGPARIICLSLMDHEASKLGMGWHYILKQPLPEDVALGRVQPHPGTGFLVIERPAIRFPLRTLN